MQVPPATSVTVEPLTVQTEVVSEEKVTASAEEAVALTAKGAAPNVLLASAPKVIVWLALATTKPWSTLAAAR